MTRRLLMVLLASVAVGNPAAAYEASTTHAGLTEQATLASKLGRYLAEVFALPLGAYEPLKVPFTGVWGERLRDALARLDPAEGYAPATGGEGRLPALEWLVAGSVVEEVPAARMGNHFFNPATRKGLTQGDFLAGAGLRMEELAAGTASVRDVMTGAAFSGHGAASIDWLVSGDNDRGLACFLDRREHAVTLPGRNARLAALAQALLCAGGVLHIIEDAAEPALVRGDFDIEFGRYDGPYRRLVAENFGRLGIAAPTGTPTVVKHLVDLIANDQGNGLADRTARRFFSLGTLPRGTWKSSSESSGYASGTGVAHLALWHRGRAGEVSWTLDEQCYADYAAILLPEATHAAWSALEHLLRGRLQVEHGVVRLDGIGLGRGRLTVLSENSAGERKMVSEKDLATVGVGQVVAELPALTHGEKLAVVVRGVDENGDPLVVSAEGITPSGP